MEKIKPYRFNGQINTLKLNEGEVADLNIAFQKDQKYRLFVCSQGNFDRVEFKVMDTFSNTVLYYNKDQDFTDTWDFISKNTQQVTIRVYIPESAQKGNMVQSGCVSILIGFQD